jgi:hypothetical protein
LRTDAPFGHLTRRATSSAVNRDVELPLAKPTISNRSLLRRVAGQRRCRQKNSHRRQLLSHFAGGIDWWNDRRTILNLL